VRLERELAAAQSRLAAYAAELEERVATRTAIVRTQAAEIESLYLRAEEAARLKSEIVSNLSHELRTPLGVILGYADVLEGCLGSDDDARDVLGKIRTQGQLLFQLVESLLALVRLRAGKEGVYATRFVLADLGTELHAYATLLSTEVSPVIDWHLPTDRGEVENDREKIRFIGYHLLSNALKFAPEGRVNVTLARTEGNGIRLTVSDSGVGFSAEAQGIVFEDFRQLDGSATRSFGGLGLGLGIVKRYAELLGGTIELASAPQSGTTISVIVPAQYLPATAEASVTPVAARAAG
jgi:signal transduction histidine kinase